MNLKKIEDDAEVYTNSNRGKHIGLHHILDANRNKTIIDCDTLQAQRNAIRPRIIEEVIVA